MPPDFETAKLYSFMVFKGLTDLNNEDLFTNYIEDFILSRESSFDLLTIDFNKRFYAYFGSDLSAFIGKEKLVDEQADYRVMYLN